MSLSYYLYFIIIIDNSYIIEISMIPHSSCTWGTWVYYCMYLVRVGILDPGDFLTSNSGVESPLHPDARQLSRHLPRVFLWQGVADGEAA